MRLRVLSAIFIALAVLLAVFVAALRAVQQSRLDAVQVDTVERAGELVGVELSNRTDMMGAALESITRDPAFKSAMRAGDKPHLGALAAPLFEQLRSRFQIDHFYFYAPNRKVIHRAHEPGHDGDVIGRASLTTAESTGKPSSGIEQGPTGNSTLRVVYPWRDGDELLGYVELGTEFENVADRVHELLDVDVILTVEKRYLEKELWEKRNEKLGRQSAWAAYADVVVIDSTVQPIPEELQLALGASPVRTEAFDIEGGGRSTHVFFLPLHDIVGQHLGQLVVLGDTTAIVSEGRRSTVIVSAVCLAIGLAMLAFFWLFLGNLGRELDDRAARLVEANAVLARRVEENARLFRQAQDSIRVRDEFLTAASHELRTPTAALLLGAERLSCGRQVLPEKLQKTVELVFRQAKRMAKLVDDMTSVGRIHLGRLDLHLEDVDLVALTREVVDRLAPSWEKAGCSVELRAGGTVQGLWDRSELDRAITNLLSNAMKFGAGKPIEVTVGEVQGVASLVVTDHGPGIDVEALQLIFEKFERAPAAHPYGGLGLGLYITRSIVVALGGSIRAESRPGKETRFILQLPIEGPQTLAAPVRAVA